MLSPRMNYTDIPEYLGRFHMSTCQYYTLHKVKRQGQSTRAWACPHPGFSLTLHAETLLHANHVRQQFRNVGCRPI